MRFRNLLETEPGDDFNLPKWIKRKDLKLLISESQGFEVI